MSGNGASGTVSRERRSCAMELSFPFAGGVDFLFGIIVDDRRLIAGQSYLFCFSAER